MPEFVTNPADATFASIGVDLITMFPMARIFKGGKIAGEYLRTIDRMGINDIKQELNRLNKARAVNRKNIFASGKSPEQIKKLEAEELELSNTIVKKLGNRRDQLRKLETAEKIEKSIKSHEKKSLDIEKEKQEFVEKSVKNPDLAKDIAKHLGADYVESDK